jgi:crotonobetainyl-CoA:carnitine CoA-transferase CaiB-like acyl-CoA transferase
VDVLAGIKVVDVTAWAFVPAAGGVLAHWGADVIKVESPRAPDPMRTQGGTLEPGGASRSFQHYSRGKRSIGLDLASDEGRELLYRLVADADVFLTSYLPATRRKLKIDVDDIRAVNPGIVYARGSGHGPKGPDAERRGYDMLSWWCRGSLAQSAMDGSGATSPTMMVGHGDGMAGMTLVSGILAALLSRERTGVAPVVDGSLLGAATWFNGPALIDAVGNPRTRTFGPVERPQGPGTTGPATMTWYQTSDFRFLYLIFLGDDDRDFDDLCAHLELPEVARDERFAHAAERVEHRDALRVVLEEVFARRPLAEWNRVLATARGAWAPVQTPEELHVDPQTLANGFLRRVDAPSGYVLPVPPVLFDEEGGDPPRAPDFAEHTDEILAALGVDDAERERLREAGVVA